MRDIGLVRNRGRLRVLETYDIPADHDASIAATPANEGVNAARFAIAATLGGPSIRGAVPDAEAARFGFGAPTASLRAPRPLSSAARAVADDADSARAAAWLAVRDGDMGAATQLLVAGLASALRRESTAAAVALARSLGNPDGAIVAGSAADAIELAARNPAQTEPLLAAAAHAHIERALRSDDAVERELASAALFEPVRSPIAAEPTRAAAPGAPSILVHGTWGWAGDWWLPGGDLHTLVAGIRSDVYRGDRPFSWSGAFRASHREIAGERLARWTESLDTVVAHSLGTETVALAALAGTPVAELVALGAPATAPIVAACERIPRVVDVRLRFDIVLALAGLPQGLPAHPHVTEVVIDRPFWSHEALRTAELWTEENVIERAGLARSRRESR